MFLGLALGFIFVTIFNLEGINKIIILIASASPVGYNTLTFASLEKLDKEFASSVISYSILTGIILTPLLLFLFS